MNSAIKQLQRSEFYWQAQRLADKHDIPDREREQFVERACLSMAHRAFREEIQPLVKAKVDMVSLFPPGISISEAGEVTRTEPNYPAGVVAALAEIDRFIADAARRYGQAPLEETAGVRDCRVNEES